MSDIRFEYYVLNYDFNGQQVEWFNIFRNAYVQEYTEKAVKKYLRSPKNFKYERQGEKPIYGFDALCKEIERTIMWQEWGRREYEISVGDAFEDDCRRLEKWDCFMQAKPNIPMIARECIYQYKEAKKNDKKQDI